MNLPIVPSDVAKDLKELGFDWDTDYGYKQIPPDWLHGNIKQWSLVPHSPYHSDIKILAPTQAEVCKWLRDEKKLFLVIGLNDYSWFYQVIDISHLSEEWVYPAKSSIYVGYKTYESAELAGIRKAIEILKEKEEQL